MNRFRLYTVAVALLGMMAGTFTASPARAGQVIDRIVATVNGRIILQSDWDEALSYESLLSGRALSFFTDEDRRAVLDRLIDQELLAEQMKSASFKHASEEDAAAEIAEARKLHPEAATAEGWQALLARYGVTEKSLTDHVEQQIDLMRLVDAHLRPAVQIDSKSIEAYYRDKFVPQLRQSGSGDVPLADVSGQIREILTQEKVSELMASWLQSLRAESKVTLPSISESPDQGVQTR
ncbi:MAG: SurA N-terminal domain-containing protein [Acidobacteriota bacterium]|jgi:peptidyl-prolyl cis-trans isomerase SurA